MSYFWCMHPTPRPTAPSDAAGPRRLLACHPHHRCSENAQPAGLFSKVLMAPTPPKNYTILKTNMSPENWWFGWVGWDWTQISLPNGFLKKGTFGPFRGVFAPIFYSCAVQKGLNMDHNNKQKHRDFSGFWYDFGASTALLFCLIWRWIDFEQRWWSIVCPRSNFLKLMLSTFSWRLVDCFGALQIESEKRASYV